MSTPAPILNSDQAAAYCGFTSKQTLYNLIGQGKGPIHYRNGRRLAFYEADLDAWNRSRLIPVDKQVAS